MDLSRIPGLLVPALCPLCRQRLDPSALICGDCMRELNLSRVIRDDPPEGIDRIASCAAHEGAARELLAAFKFRHLTGLAGLIAGFMADAITTPESGALVLGVPPARLRTWLRGFDPVGLLTGQVAGLSGIEPLAQTILARHGSGRQRGRGRAGRIADPPDIRAVAAAGKFIGGREVLLIDDVMTTGATLAAVAGVLRAAGVSSVFALTFTRRL